MSIHQYKSINYPKFFKALADETRLRILRILTRGTFHVNEILYIVGGKQSNTSHHLKIMQESGLIKNKREGSWIFYRINELENTASIKQIIEALKIDEKKIPSYEEDIKRLDAILQKRKNHAENFFNKIGSDFDNIQATLFKDIYSVEEALNLLKVKLNTILDIGCGTGRNLPLLTAVSDKVIGIDASPSMLQLSEHYCKINKLNYELKLGDINNIPLESKSIDGIFTNMVLHHISDPEEALKEVSRVLNENGKLILIELLSHQNEFMREKYADLWLGFSMDELEKWLKNSNLAIKEKIIKDKNGKNEFKIAIIIAEKNSM